MRFLTLGCLAATVLATGAAARSLAEERADTFTLHLRGRAEAAPKSGRYHAVTTEARWDARKTAVVICDMWDDHWCKGAAARVAELAPRVNDFVARARARGAFILHAPSSVVAHYDRTPQRQLARQAPFAKTPVPLSDARRWGTGWSWPDKKREADLPVDDSDMGCDCAAKCSIREAWTRQVAAIEMKPGDAVTDDGQETYNLLAARGIDNVLICGVHLNMCVLGRPFGIRQLTHLGKQVALVRDLTDTMYNSQKAPFVSHFTGTDLVVEHVEKYWCPTVLSTDVLGGQEFRFREDGRPHLVVVAAEDEYQTERTLPAFARKELGRTFRVSYVFADEKARHNLPGVSVLQEADVMLLSVRRRPLQADQLARFRAYLAAGKPLVAIRTSSHAFAPPKGGKLPPGVAEWPDFDHAVLGGNYQGHHGATLRNRAVVAEGAAQHPLLNGVPADGFTAAGSLYKSRPLAPGAVALLTGRAEGVPDEPVAWTYTRQGGGKVFYTSLGHPGDFENPAFVRLLRNALAWAAEK